MNKFFLFSSVPICVIRGGIPMSRLLCVYCSSSERIDPKYHEAGRQLGRQLVEHGWDLVFGGSSRGTMRELALAVKAAGGRVVGVIPEFMKAREWEFTEADELVTVTTMRERRRLMEERAGAFVTLPGGIGTLEEFIEIATARYLKQVTRPLVLVNLDGFYDDLLRQFARGARDGFRPENPAEVFAVVRTVEEIWPLLAA